MRAKGRQEMQLDPAPGPGQPFLHELGVVIARVVQEYVDADHEGIQRFQRFEQPDRRLRVDRFGFDQAGLAALQIDRAVDVDALAPARLLDRELLFLGRPAAHGPRRMGRMHRVHEHRDLVVAHGIHQVFVARNERLLRFRIELARDDFGLVIFESQAMQQRDQPRAAFVDEAEFLRDPGADLARRARQGRPDPGLQSLRPEPGEPDVSWGDGDGQAPTLRLVSRSWRTVGPATAYYI